ncbi:MAG: hypothetical protein AAGA36_00375 [Pseudomonadota bacterium]
MKTIFKFIFFSVLSIIGLFLLFFFASIFDSASAPGRKSNRYATQKYYEFEAKDAVKALLKDPDSSKIKIRRTQSDTFCGTVNSKNSFGAYAGQKAFVVKKNRVIYLTGTIGIGQEADVVEWCNLK